MSATPSIAPAATAATGRARPPFRADQVGSLLRPQRLKAARERLLGVQTHDRHLAPHDNAELRAIEDECVREAVAMQERAGLRAVTDGEFRRRSWWLELILNWQGVAADRTGTTEMAWRNESGVRQAASRLWINGPVRWQPSPIVRAFVFLKAHTACVPKVTIPAPMVLHMFSGGNKGIGEGHYKRIGDFWDDVVAAYRQEVSGLAAAGASYIQFDDTSIAFLCDPAHRATVERWGSKPDALLVEYAERMNQVLAVLPPSVTVTLHQCRGNREGNWMAEGGYDPVADVLFNRINVHGYFLEYDTPRAGAPLTQGQGRRPRSRVHQDCGARTRRRPQAPHRGGGAIRTHRPVGVGPAMRFCQLGRRQSAERRRAGSKAQEDRGGGDRRVGRAVIVRPPFSRGREVPGREK
jgi:methionine synthase II (cobalamin-independent)